MSTTHQELLADIATAYYLDNTSKVEIAKEHGISRFQVARYLDEARREGVVDITIHRPAHTQIDAAALAAVLGVEGVDIAREPAGRSAREAVAVQAAATLDSLARKGCTIGVSWSRTLSLMTTHLGQLPTCDVVQLAGDLRFGNDAGSGQLIHQLGTAAGGRTWPLPAPLIVESAQLASSLRRLPEISEAQAKADHLDIAMVAIGTWTSGRSTVWARVSEEERASIAAAGAVAEISGRLLTETGEHVDAGLDGRVIAVTIDQLRAATTTVAIAYGLDNLPGVLAALRGGFIQRLVIDGDLAAALAEHAGLDAA
ncbi:sugar-binding transcriptional regulator [Zhihengliuella salsuginis]|uniref:DNA-binding transcriptional regulator n=1 Tax=Zhihengliuella salsuginis TaxID=578222 RepID=A0ABQ3GA81_9MICC|nr:sugar-binding domain-containing protein [Zhihengliuella salsuginis]GHC99563.1 DNA-binding transcriptional regulator [Zhihengliuella salsuginis]